MIDKDSTTNVAKSILVVKDAEAETSDVNYAIYKGVGETDEDGTLHTFYVAGEQVQYYVGTTLAAGLSANTVYDITVTDGVVTAASAATKASSYAFKVAYVDDTFMIIKYESYTITVYFKDGCAVYNKDNSYKADVIEVNDIVYVYDVTDGTEANTTWKDAKLVIIDN